MSGCFSEQSRFFRTFSSHQPSRTSSRSEWIHFSLWLLHLQEYFLLRRSCSCRSRGGSIKSSEESPIHRFRILSFHFFPEHDRYTDKNPHISRMRRPSCIHRRAYLFPSFLRRQESRFRHKYTMTRNTEATRARWRYTRHHFEDRWTF